MKTFQHMGCTVTAHKFNWATLIGCNGVNRYRKNALRVTFPDGTWVVVGTADDARRYVEANVDKYQGKKSSDLS